MKVKVRISHFTSKNIPINEKTRPVPTEVHTTNETKKTKKVTALKPINSNKRVSARDFVKSEIQYASVPKKPSSELLEFIVRRDAAEFREIKDKPRRVQKSIKPYNGNGQAKENEATNSSIDHSYSQ